MDDETAHLIVQPSGENSARHDKTRAHAQPRRLTTAANNDNAYSTSQMSKSRETMQELHKSAVSPPALAEDHYIDS
jgi:hypothetical protein